MKALALVALLAAAACGVKGRPFPPEVVQPDAPSELIARSTVDGVQLKWRRPTHYSGGKHMRDLGGFDIDRASDGDFAHVGRVELTDQTRFRQDPILEWTDTTVADATTYRYRVTAYTVDGYRSKPGGPLTVEYHKPKAAPATP
jgi:predicted small lipoprotein YifL